MRTTHSVAAAPATKTLRHLEYSFTVSEQDMSGYQYSGISTSTSGAGSVTSSDGGHGTKDIDVLSIAPDGALVVKISESVYLEPHARQLYEHGLGSDSGHASFDFQLSKDSFVE
jgi:hypothetical protein